MNIPDLSEKCDYRDIFDSRGSLYHNAMVSQPRARDLEFHSLFSKVPILDGEFLVDVPSGGGYLEAFLARNMKPGSAIHVENLEFSSGFGPVSTVVSLNESWPLMPESVDRVVCLASSHHIHDLSALFFNVEGVLKTGGFFHLADVAPGSGVEAFLENFVHCYTPGGHRGFYRDFFLESYPSTFDIVDVSLRACPWHFESIDQMLRFCCGLFGLQGCSVADLESALRDCVGVEDHLSGVKLNWELVYVDMKLK